MAVSGETVSRLILSIIPPDGGRDCHDLVVGKADTARDVQDLFRIPVGLFDPVSQTVTKRFLPVNGKPERTAVYFFFKQKLQQTVAATGTPLFDDKGIVPIIAQA